MSIFVFVVADEIAFLKKQTLESVHLEITAVRLLHLLLNIEVCLLASSLSGLLEIEFMKTDRVP